MLHLPIPCLSIHREPSGSLDRVFCTHSLIACFSPRKIWLLPRHHLKKLFSHNWPRSRSHIQSTRHLWHHRPFPPSWNATFSWLQWCHTLWFLASISVLVDSPLSVLPVNANAPGYSVPEPNFSVCTLPLSGLCTTWIQLPVMLMKSEFNQKLFWACLHCWLGISTKMSHQAPQIHHAQLRRAPHINKVLPPYYLPHTFCFLFSFSRWKAQLSPNPPLIQLFKYPVSVLFSTCWIIPIRLQTWCYLSYLKTETKGKMTSFEINFPSSCCFLALFCF